MTLPSICYYRLSSSGRMLCLADVTILLWIFFLRVPSVLSSQCSPARMHMPSPVRQCLCQAAAANLSTFPSACRHDIIFSTPRSIVLRRHVSLPYELQGDMATRARTRSFYSDARHFLVFDCYSRLMCIFCVRPALTYLLPPSTWCYRKRLSENFVS